MEQCLFILLFLTGGVSLAPPGLRKIYLIQQQTTWSGAQSYCRSKHMDLATMESDEDVIQLQTEAQQFNSSAWIGLYNDINNWRWALRDEALGSWTSWRLGEPNNLSGDEECVWIENNDWHDGPCKTLQSFVCFDETASLLNTYKFYADQKSWFDAQQYCRQYHTDLASDRNLIEHSVICSISTSIVWIGLNRDSWKWSDRTVASDLRWAPGEPDNLLLKENCAVWNGGLIADMLCSNVRPFFCYSVITGQQQIVRVSVQSNRNGNDPAVKAAILGQIMKNLTHHGLAGKTSVKFREQPDGKVFHKLQDDNITNY